MGRIGGRAAIARGRTHAYGGTRIAACGALLATLALAPAAAAQSTGGATPVEASKPAAPKLSAPPPGVKLRPAPTVGSWRCLSDCVDARQVHTGSVLRVRGLRLGRTFEVKFLGAEGPQDDVATAPLERDRKRVDVRVPLGAVSGPIVLADRDELGSAPTAAPLAIHPPVAPLAMAAGPRIEVQTTARRAYVDAAEPAEVTYVVRGAPATAVTVDLVRAGAVVKSWSVGAVAADTTQTLTWNGTIAGRLAKAGRYAFRVTAEGASGVRAVSARARRSRTRPRSSCSATSSRSAARTTTASTPPRFGGGRGHQGHDVFAACGTPIVAARGGIVKFEQYHSRAGHYIVVDGAHTGTDYAYMHMRERGDRRCRRPRAHRPADRLRRARPAARSAATCTSRCGTRPGWYDGGRPFDPLPSLLAWDRRS